MTTPSAGKVTSQLAEPVTPSPAAMLFKPGTITHPTMMVKQATHKSENAPTGFSALIGYFLKVVKGNKIYETTFSYTTCYTVVSQLSGGFNG
jgi:hypothetical protein